MMGMVYKHRHRVFVYLVIAAVLVFMLAVLGCESRENTFFEPNSGTVTIRCLPDSLTPSWELVREKGGTWTGKGPKSITDLEAGIYELTWSDAPGWLVPDLNPRTLKMLWGQTIDFVGNFNRIPPRGFNITAPVWGTVWQPGLEKVAITWTGGYPEMPVTIQLFQNNDLVDLIVESTDNDGVFDIYDVPYSVTPDSNYRIRITQGSYSQFGSYFPIADSLTVISPTTGSIWRQGETGHSIDWTGGSKSRSIDVILNVGDDQLVIAKDTKNDGHIRFDILVDIELGDEYQICLKQSLIGTCGAMFSISGPELLVITKPVTGAVWEQGSANNEVTWSGGIAKNLVSLSLHQKDTWVADIATEVPNNGSLYFSIPPELMRSDDYKVCIQQSDMSACGTIFSVVGPQSLEVTKPAGDEIWVRGGGSYNISWTGGMPNQLVDLTLHREGDWVADIATKILNVGYGDFSAPLELVGSDNYTVQVSQGDSLGISSPFTVTDYTILMIADPDGNTRWDGGEVATIIWSGGDPNLPVSITLYWGGADSLAISDNAENNGKFDFFVPPGIEASFGYQVGIKQQDLNDLSPRFQIGPKAPIIIDEPSSDTEWIPGQSGVSISWSGGDIDSWVSIFLYRGVALVDTVTLYAGDHNFNSYNVPYDIEPADDYSIVLKQTAYTYQGEQFSIVDIPFECDISPAELDFGPVVVGVELQQYVVVTNQGGPEDFNFSLTCNEGEFYIISGGGQVTLSFGEKHYVVVGYTPQGVGIDSCTLDTGNECGEVPLVGEGISP